MAQTTHITTAFQARHLLQGGFADARLKARPHGPDTAQVSLISFPEW